MAITTYDTIAPGYDELYGSEQINKVRCILNRIALKDSDIALDVGSGSGIGAALFPCRIIGIDPTMGLLEQNTFPVVCGVGEFLPFEDMSFDFVFSLTAIHNFFNYHAGLEEMNRVAKDTLVITVLKKSSLHNEIIRDAETIFDSVETIDEAKDSILICKKKKN